MTEDVPKTDAGKAREGLIDELKTINHYEEMADESKDPVLKRQFEEITDDEKVHVGNFAEMIADKDKKAEPLMREGLEEAMKMRKSMFYSFKDMMRGASHFEKRGKETSPEERRIRQKMSDRARDKKVRSHPQYMIRAGQIPAGTMLNSRAQDAEGVVLDSIILPTRWDMGDEFNRVATLYGPGVPFGYNDRVYMLQEAKNGGEQYVYAPDPTGIYKYRQLKFKKLPNGEYVEDFVTPKMPEHGNVEIPEPMTPEIARKYYADAQRDERVATSRDKRDFATRDLAKLREERNPGNPLDKWDVNAELERGDTAPFDLENPYADEGDLDSRLLLVQGDGINDYKQRKATKARIEAFNDSEFYPKVMALASTLAKPRIFLNGIGEGAPEKIEALGTMVLGPEKTNEIISRKGNPEANVNALSKEVAKFLNTPANIMGNVGLMKKLNKVVDDWGKENPVFLGDINVNMDKWAARARGDNRDKAVDHNYRLNARDNLMREAARAALAQKIAKRKEIERNYRNQVPKGTSVEAAQGIKRFNRDSFVPRLYGKAFPLSRIQGYENILPDELAFAAIRGSNERADVRRLIADQRRARDEANAANAIAERTALLNKFPDYEDYLIDAETQREEDLKRILQESQERADGTRRYFEPSEHPSIMALLGTPEHEKAWREGFHKDYLDKKWLDSLNETYKKEYGFDPNEARGSIEKEFHEVPSIMVKKMVGKDEQGNPIYEEMGLETPAKVIARGEQKRRLKGWESKNRPFMEKKRYLDWVKGQFKDYGAPLKQKLVLNPESGFWENTYEDDDGRARNDYYMSKYGVPFDVASKAQQRKIKEDLDAEWPELVAAQKEKIRQSITYKTDINERKKEWIKKALRERYGDQLYDYGKWIQENNDWSDVWGDYGTAYATNSDELDDAYIKHLSEQNAIDAYKDENGRWRYTSRDTGKELGDSYYDVKHPSDVVAHNSKVESAHARGASSRSIDMATEGQEELNAKPKDYKAQEEDISEFGQGPKLQSLGGPGGPGPKVKVIEKEGKKMETEPIARSASFREMLKSATAKKWGEKGLPSGSMEKTLPAYYRTVTMGCDKDAINVYEHQNMPVGGKGISMKKVPGIGSKMSTKGDE